MYKFEEKVYNAVKEEVYVSYMDATEAGEMTAEVRANYLLMRRLDKELEKARINYDAAMNREKKKN